jgi:GTPase KRas protein
LEIVDTAGQDEFKALRATYMRQCYGFMLVADITSTSSLENLVEFIQELDRVKDGRRYPCVLVLNKRDLEKDRKLTIKNGQEFAQKYLNSCPVFEASAKERYNIDESFYELIKECRKVKRIEQGLPEVGDEKKKKGGLFSSMRSNKENKDDLDMFNKK